MSARTSIRVVALASALAVPVAAPVRAERLVIDPEHSSVLYFYNHFGLSERNGRFQDLEGTLELDRSRPERSSVTVKVKTVSVSSGVAALDEVLRSADFFEVANYPDATFRSTKVRRTGPKTAAITGEFTLRGVTRPLVLDATFTGVGLNPATKDQVTGFHASGTLNRSAYGIKAFAPAVGDRITLRIDAEFKLVPPAGQ